MQKIEENILNLFTYNNSLKFNEIEKNILIRSNKLTYHLKKLIKKGIISKENDYYKISEDSEYLIPYISEKNHVLPVILIYIGDNKKCFLYQRKKRPFKDYFSLPGGRMILGESIGESVKRIMKEKYNINARLIKINSISLEHLKKKEKIMHSYLLILVSAKTKDKIKFYDIIKERKNIISSDLYLLNNDILKKINIKTLNTIRF
jgi:ADP-ribose pyrophosphatase YjhB (NUDIX family)